MTPEDDYHAGCASQVVHRERALVRAFGATAAVALVVAAPAIVARGDVRALVGLARPKPIVAQAELLLSAPVGNSFCAPASTVPSSTGGQCDFLTTDHRPVVHRPPQVNGQPVRRRFVFAPWRAGASSPAAQTPEGRLTALTWPVRRFKMHDSWQRKGEEP